MSGVFTLVRRRKENIKIYEKKKKILQITKKGEKPQILLKLNKFDIKNKSMKW